MEGYLMKISCIPRDTTGTSTAKRLRQNDFIPGVIYGKGISPENISVSKKEIEKALKKLGENAILDLTLNDKSFHAMVKDVHHDYSRDKLLHIDFYQINMTQKLQISVPIRLLNSDHIQALGALVHQLNEIEIECTADNIPKSIDLDVAELQVGHGISVAELIVDDTITILSNAEDTIVSLSPHRAEEEDAEATEGQESAEPVVIGSEEETEK
jgi:large subunit ribosomal protein L25